MFFHSYVNVYQRVIISKTISKTWNHPPPESKIWTAADPLETPPCVDLPSATGWILWYTPRLAMGDAKCANRKWDIPPEWYGKWENMWYVILWKSDLHPNYVKYLNRKNMETWWLANDSWAIPFSDFQPAIVIHLVLSEILKIYPLVNSRSELENPHFWSVNQLFLWSFSIANC